MAAARKENYFIYLSILTILLLVVYYFLKDKLPVSAAYIIPAFYLITAGAHYLLMKSINQNPRKFYYYFLAAMSFKMLAYLTVLSLILLIDGQITIEFVIAFFAVYVCYTVFEMAMILPRAKRNAS
jgi:hypothetical protein